MIIRIVHKNGRKTELEIEGTDTVRQIMEKFYDKINLNMEKRLYAEEKVIFKLGDQLLNSNNKLNETADNLGLEEDDTLEWLDKESINAGKK